MRRALLSLGVIVLIAGAAAAVDIRLRDGTVIEAESYKVTGSYVMLKLSDGRQVAYDVTDVDLDALRAAETAVAEGQAKAAADGATDTLSSGRSLKDASAVGDDQGTGLKISDRDVRHIRGSGVLGEGEEAEDSATEGGVPEGFEQGSGVVLNGIRVMPAGEGRWQVEGEVVNRNPDVVQNVRVQLETIPAGDAEPWRADVPVAGSLGPNEKAVFSHGFAAEAPAEGATPNVRASVIWMRQETRRVPDYTKGGGVPHPSNLPLEHGGVSGADVRPTEVE